MSKLPIFFGVKLVLFSIMEVAIEGRLKSINMKLFIEIAEIYPGCFSFRFFASEGAFMKLNSRIEFGANIGESSDVLWIFWARVSIEKTVHPK